VLGRAEKTLVHGQEIKKTKDERGGRINKRRRGNHEGKRDYTNSNGTQLTIPREAEEKGPRMKKGACRGKKRRQKKKRGWGGRGFAYEQY